MAINIAASMINRIYDIDLLEIIVISPSMNKVAELYEYYTIIFRDLT
jgi:hypothetical protein